MLAIVVLGLPALTACGGGDDDDAQATATGDDGDAPAVYLRNSSGDAEPLVAGTGCWSGKCIDMAGPLTNVDPVPLHPGERVAFSFEAGVPDNFTVTWIEAPATAPAPEGDVRVWGGLAPGAGGFSGTTAPSGPGKYIVVVFAQWEGQGDMSYGLYVDVEPGT
ncbi:MAG: hypothetical protein ACM3S1_03130 [Hyphomicrobiales bacterium]